jgi:hypothetical protein
MGTMANMQNYQRAWHDISERGGKTLACDFCRPAAPKRTRHRTTMLTHTAWALLPRALYRLYNVRVSGKPLDQQHRPSKSRCRPHFSLFSLDVALSTLYAQYACIDQAPLQVYPPCNQLSAYPFTHFTHMPWLVMLALSHMMRLLVVPL